MSEHTTIPTEEARSVQPLDNGISDEAWNRCGPLAREPRILDVFAAELRSQGLVGEDRAAKLLYLVLNTRFLLKLVSAVVKGPSSGGKSYLVSTVLKFFPEDSYHELTGMSDKALAYGEEPIEHRFLVIFEAVGLRGEFASYLMRSLLSEGYLKYQTVESIQGTGLRPRTIERKNPTGLLLTTTEIKIHPENETRLLSIPVNDSPDQTKAIMLASALGRKAEPVNSDLGCPAAVASVGRTSSCCPIWPRPFLLLRLV